KPTLDAPRVLQDELEIPASYESAGALQSDRKIAKSGEGTAAARPGAGCTSKAVRCGRDPGSRKGTQIVHSVDGERASSGAQRNRQHLVEIAIVQSTFPSHADQGSAHQVLDGGRIEVIDQQSHVLGMHSRAIELVGEPCDGHVVECEQAIKA